MKREKFGKEYRHKVASLRLPWKVEERQHEASSHFWIMHPFKNLIKIKGSHHRIKYTYTHHRGFCTQFQGFSLQMSQGSIKLRQHRAICGMDQSWVCLEREFVPEKKFSYLTHFTKQYSKFIKKINNFSTIKY